MPIWDREEGRERERERKKERHREIRQIKLFGVERHQFGTERMWERERETQRDTSNQAFWGGKAAIWDGEGGREKEKERDREICQIKLFGVERHQFGTGTKGERERERERQREIRQIKLFGVERHQFGTEREWERERETQRDTSNQAFWGGKAAIWDGEGGKKKKRETERYVKSSFSGWKDTNLGPGRREREKEKERDREIRQIKLFGVERHQFGTERKGESEKERHREIRQIKLFGVERHQFGTGTKGERERERETQRDTSNQAFWGGKTPIWDREEGRERERKRDTERYVKSSFLGWKDTNLGQRGRERERQRDTSNQAFWGGKSRQRWFREKTLGVLRSLGFLHLFLYFPNFSIFFLYLGMVTGDGFRRRLWAYYVVQDFGLLYFFSYFLHFSCIWGWLREMVTATT